MIAKVAGTGQVEITFEYVRHLGPRYAQGGLTLRFDGTRPYSFRSEASWPASDSYEDSIRVAVEQVILEHLGTLDRTEVVLKQVMWDDVSSSKHGFAEAARAATIAALEVGKS